MSAVRFLKNGTSGTPTDMLLPVFGGEILVAYQEFNQFIDKVKTQTIESGISAKFPATWKIGSEIHQAGTELLGTDVETKEYTILLDTRPRVAHFEVDDIDETLAHFSVRQELAAETGRELARQIDKQIAKLLILASRTAASGSFEGGGTDRNGTDLVDNALGTANAAGALALLAAIDTTVVGWDTTDVPENDRVCVVKAPLWYQLRRLGTLVSGVSAGPVPLMGHNDIDQTNPKIQVGLAKSEYLMHQGVKIYRSNHLPTQDLSADGTNYAGNYSNIQGICWQKDAIGFVQKLGVTTEQFRDVRRQSDFMVAKTLTGGGTLRPKCAVAFASA